MDDDVKCYITCNGDMGCKSDDVRSPLLRPDTEDFKNSKTSGKLLYQIVYREISDKVVKVVTFY